MSLARFMRDASEISPLLPFLAALLTTECNSSPKRTSYVPFMDRNGTYCITNVQLMIPRHTQTSHAVHPAIFLFQHSLSFRDVLSPRYARLDCKRPLKTLYDAILVILVRISTSAEQPPSHKRSIRNQLCALSVPTEPPEDAPGDP